MYLSKCLVLLTAQFVESRHCRPCAVASTPLHLSGGYQLRGAPAASHTRGSLTEQPHEWQPSLRMCTRLKRNQHRREGKQPLLVGRVGEGPFWVLTREVDGVQRDPLSFDKTSNPLQLSLANIVLEENIIREVHVADRLGLFAVDCNGTVLGVNVESYCLRDGALVVLHYDPSWRVFWTSLKSKKEEKVEKGAW